MLINDSFFEKRVPIFILSSLLSSYPDDTFSEYIRHILNESSVNSFCATQFPEQWSKLKLHFDLLFSDENEISNLRSDFIDIFERGRQSNPLYETEFGRSRALVKGHELGDIAGFYKAFGFAIGSDENPYRDMVDHVAVELEFYALLLMKQEELTLDSNQEGMEIVTDARGKFLKDHLGRFVSALSSRPGVAAHPFYHDVFKFIDEIVKLECRLLNISPDITEWIDGKLDTTSPTCGSLNCLSGVN